MKKLGIKKLGLITFVLVVTLTPGSALAKKGKDGYCNADYECNFDLICQGHECQEGCYGPANCTEDKKCIGAREQFLIGDKPIERVAGKCYPQFEYKKDKHGKYLKDKHGKKIPDKNKPYKGRVKDLCRYDFDCQCGSFCDSGSGDLPYVTAWQCASGCFSDAQCCSNSKAPNCRGWYIGGKAGVTIQTPGVCYSNKDAGKVGTACGRHTDCKCDSYCSGGTPGSCINGCQGDQNCCNGKVCKGNICIPRPK